MPSDPSRRGEQQRPTLPPIRQVFGAELSQSVPPQQSRQPSSSPQVPYGRLPLTDEERRYMTQSPSMSGGSRASNHPYAHSHPSLQVSPRPSTPSGHPRNASEPVYRTQTYGVPPQSALQQQYAPRGQPHPSMYTPQGGYSMGSGTFPYAPVQAAPHPSQSIVATTSRAGVADPPASGRASARYECEYCGRGFTRPSSLKIHLNTHTGEKPFTCPFEGCGRSFSVQSNMRRHARVHTRGAGAQAEPGDDSPEEGDEPSSEGSKHT